jgi:8-oxo-dGTP pyrophosphatase MutT (NUDIX family)
VALAGVGDHEANRARILAFVDAHPDALHRACAEGHLTGSALVVDVESRRILLLFHTKVRRWLQPGGHADGDGNLAAVALREAEEETGIEGLAVVVPAIDLDVHVFHHGRRNGARSPPSRRPPPRPGAGSAQAVKNEESEALQWVTVDELSALDVDEGTHRMARAGLEALDELGW